MAAPSPYRRRLLAVIAATPLLSLKRAFATAADPVTLIAAWDSGAARHAVGLIQVDLHSVRVLHEIEVPTRAHGVTCTADGSVVLAVARRPGDWMLRWRPGAAVEWLWAGDARRFSGHVAVAPDGSSIHTTEFDLDTGQGLLVRRDASTLAEVSAWPTGGRDPHDLEWLDEGTLLVANGGVETLLETGRAKHNLARMDSSLVRLDPRTGRLIAQWRLEDRRLSIRHLARHRTGAIGIALQAEHDEPSSRAAAPVFAALDLQGNVLRPHAAVRTPAGYAGDIAAVRDGWLVSCPRDDHVLFVPDNGAAPVTHPLAQGCAIAAERHADRSWVLGSAAALTIAGLGVAHPHAPALRFDNHAQFWSKQIT